MSAIDFVTETYDEDIAGTLLELKKSLVWNIAEYPNIQDSCVLP